MRKKKLSPTFKVHPGFLLSSFPQWQVLTLFTPPAPTLTPQPLPWSSHWTSYYSDFWICLIPHWLFWTPVRVRLGARAQWLSHLCWAGLPCPRHTWSSWGFSALMRWEGLRALLYHQQEMFAWWTDRVAFNLLQASWLGSWWLWLTRMWLEISSVFLLIPRGIHFHTAT